MVEDRALCFDLLLSELRRVRPSSGLEIWYGSVCVVLAARSIVDVVLHALVDRSIVKTAHLSTHQIGLVRKLSVSLDFHLLKFPLALLGIEVERIKGLIDLDGTVGIDAVFFVLALRTLCCQSLGLRINCWLKRINSLLFLLVLFQEPPFLLPRYLFIHQQRILKLLCPLPSTLGCLTNQGLKSNIVKFLKDFFVSLLLDSLLLQATLLAADIIKTLARVFERLLLLLTDVNEVLVGFRRRDASLAIGPGLPV